MNADLYGGNAYGRSDVCLQAKFVWYKLVIVNIEYIVYNIEFVSKMNLIYQIWKLMITLELMK